MEIHPLTPERWEDLEAIFGPSGEASGCWCMYLRETSKEFDAGCRNGGEANRERFREVVRSGSEPGLLAYREDRPVGWVAVAPREEYPRVLRSPLHKPIDGSTGVWAITCFFIDRSERGLGVASALLEAAVAFCRAKGAAIVEAYPSDPGDARPPAGEMWRGSLAQFSRAGFEVVDRRKPARPIVRRILA